MVAVLEGDAPLFAGIIAAVEPWPLDDWLYVATATLPDQLLVFDLRRFPHCPDLKPGAFVKRGGAPTGKLLTIASVTIKS